GLKDHGNHPRQPARPWRCLCRTYYQGREARRSAGPAGGETRTRHQPQDRESARTRRADVAAHARRCGGRMKRRAFMTLLGGATAWPLAARAQQPAMPAVGFLSHGPAEPDSDHAPDCRKGLNEAGFTDGRNVAIEYRWANFQMDRLPGLAADLVRRQAAVIAATGNLGVVLAAKGAAAATTPIVFNVGIDPVKHGLVAALNKPGGNITGITSVNTQLGSKHVGLMHELLPNATRLALLVYRDDAGSSMDMITGAREAAAALGLQIDIVYASTGGEIETALAGIVQKQAGALIISPGKLFIPRPRPIATLAVPDA